MIFKPSLKFIVSSIIAIILICITIGLYDVSVKHSFTSNYYPSDFINSFKTHIHLGDSNNIYVDSEGLALLNSNDVKLQILDKNNKEVYSYNKPKDYPTEYNNEILINLYTNPDQTMFLFTNYFQGNDYTTLFFFNPNKVERLIFAYNKDQLIKAHNFPLFIAIVIIFILLISCIYLIHITRPIKRLVDRINNLSKGKYSIENVGKGIYSDVRESLNILSNRLYTNELERNKLEEMRKEWISNISHDIKTPLTSIRGNAEIMSVKDYKINDEQRIRYSNIIINKVDYIKNLVEDLNLSSHLKDKNLLLNKKEVNIISLIRHVIIDIMNDDKFNNGSINFTFYENDIKINLDENLIKRVFINLIINSFLHNDYKVNVEVKVERINKSRVKIVIEDDGKGVSKKDLRYIFERYYRGTNTSSQIEGSGLGMAIAHDIIEAHSGAIYAESIQGKGMKLTILL